MNSKMETENTGNAGRIDPGWLIAARSNEGEGESVEGWICRAENASSADVDENGCVWLHGPGAGRWLNQDEIDALCVLIDRGV